MKVFTVKWATNHYKMLQLFLVVLMIASLSIHAETNLVPNKVAEFLLANGLKRVTIAACQNNFEMVTNDLFFRNGELLKHNQFYTSVLCLGEYEDVSQKDFYIFPPKALMSNLSKVANTVSKAKVRMSLMVLEDNRRGIIKLSETLAESKKNLFFYVVTTLEKELHWFQVITLSTGFSINKIQFREHMVIDDTYFDLNGLRIRSIDLDWEPYVWVSDSNKRAMTQ